MSAAPAARSVEGAAPQGKASVAPRGPDARQAVVNLARRPFANTRHIRRLGIVLWVVAAGLLAADGILYWRSLFGIESKKEERGAIDRKIADERERLATAERRLAAVELDDQNFEARFLNARIAERTFPWSALFSELAAVLPRQVRVMSLAPATGTKGNGSRGRETEEEMAVESERKKRVFLELTGVAESDEALLELLDNLFASPAFDAPTLPTERFVGGGVEFRVSVYYLPGHGGEAATPTASPTPAPPEVVEEPGQAAPDGAAAAEGEEP